MLFDACHLYKEITGINITQIPELHVFRSWVLMKYPDLIIEDSIKDQIVELLEGIDLDNFDVLLNQIDLLKEQQK